MDTAVVVATLVGPILAVQTQKVIERMQERYKAREHVFKTLMGTRGALMSGAHVQALNMIELEFRPVWYERVGKRQRLMAVIEKWRELHSVFRSVPPGGSPSHTVEVWASELEKTRIDMLYVMAQSLSYPFDRTTIKESWYAPNGHKSWETQEEEIRSGVADLVMGRRVLLVRDAPRQEAVNTSSASSLVATNDRRS